MDEDKANMHNQKFLKIDSQKCDDKRVQEERYGR
jgi:hypothetical protein